MSRTAPAIGGYVFDIDGTLAMMDQKTKTYRPLPGAVDVLDRVRMAGLGAVAYTNGTFHVPAHYYEQLAAVGLPFAPGHILTPASVAAHHFRALGLTKILLIAAEGVRVPVEAAGIATCAPGDPLTGVEAVLVGWQPDFSRKELDAACTAIWAGAAFFATSLAPYFASANGRMIGISGAISAMVTSVTGKKPTLLGKPGPIGLKMAASILKAPVASLVVIGDDPKLEILMARRGKAYGIGVTTGENDRAAFMALPELQRAHEIYASLPEALGSHLFPASAKPSAKRRLLA